MGHNVQHLLLPVNDLPPLDYGDEIFRYLRYLLTVLPMELIHVDVTISFPRMVDVIPVRNLPHERPRIFGQWVKIDPVDTYGEELSHCDQPFAPKYLASKLTNMTASITSMNTKDISGPIVMSGKFLLSAK